MFHNAMVFPIVFSDPFVASPDMFTVLEMDLSKFESIARIINILR